jgi:hypothetical protein
MSGEANLSCRTIEAGADLSALQYCFVKMSSGKAVSCDTAGEMAIGVLQNNPTSGEMAVIAVSGKTYVKAGAAIAQGAKVATKNNGRADDLFAVAVVNTSDAGGASDPVIASYVMGWMWEAAAANGDLKLMELVPMGAVPSTVA